MRSEDRAVRSGKAFVPADGYELLVADYNQIELRCIAHLAEDPGLIDAFEAGRDIHTATAAAVFGVDPDEVTSEQRSKAKMVSYGLAYGMEAYGLGQRLGIPTGEAQDDPRRLLRGVPVGAGLHGSHGGRGPGAGLHRDALRTPPPDPRAVSSRNFRDPPGG